MNYRAYFRIQNNNALLDCSELKYGEDLLKSKQFSNGPLFAYTICVV